MIRNEYRRAFIMLRPALPGYGGHARLERRTATGSLYVVVTAPEGAGALEAALAGQANGEYFAAALGPLRRDRRGQLTLAIQFDPRNVGGRPLEAYHWLTVARAEGGCAVALNGNLEGSRELDAAALERAVCALYAAPEAPAADIPEPGEPASAPAAPEPEAAPPADSPEPEPAPEAQAAPAENPAPSQEDGSDVKIYVRSKARVYTAAARQEAREDPADAAPAEPPRSAAAALGLDASSPWNGALEPLRRLFAENPPAEGAPEDGYTYVRAPMPAGCGCDACFIGLHAADGAADGIRYAIPGANAAEPPAGMDGYAWSQGFWIIDAPVE